MGEVEKLRQQVDELRLQVESLTNDKKCLLTAQNFAAKPQILANNQLQVPRNCDSCSLRDYEFNCFRTLVV